MARGQVKKGNGSWFFVVDLPRGLDGRRRQMKRRGFRTRKEAEAALQARLAEISSGTLVEPLNLTLERFLRDRWLPAVEGQLRPSTFNSYKGNLERHVLPALGMVKLQSVAAPEVTILYNRLVSEKGLSPKTVRHVHTTLRKAFADAEKWRLVERNPIDAAERPRLQRTEMKTWSASQTRTFLDRLAGDPLHATFTLLCTTGMRRGEVLGLRWSDLDLEVGRASVQQTLTSVNYELVFGEPKTSRGRRSIPLDSTTMAVLKQHRANHAAVRLAAGSVWSNDRDLVFVREDGSPLHPDTVSDTFDRRVEKFNLPKIRLHDLRHTWATLALENGVPVKVVSEVLGHSSPSFTLDVYSHVTPVMMEDLARVVGESIFRGTVGE